MVRPVFAIAAAMLSGGTTTALAGTQPGWEEIASLPAPSGGFAAGVVKGDIVVIGGTNWEGGNKHWLNRIWTYNSAKGQWRERGRFDVPLAYAAVAQAGETLWIAGGSSGTATHRSIWKLEEPGSARVAFSLRNGVVFASAAVVGGALYIVGGTDDQGRLENAAKTCLAVSLQTGATSRRADYPLPLLNGAAAGVGGRMFVFGGAQWDAAAKQVANHGSAFAYSPAADRWEPLPPLPTAVRGLAATVLDEHHILLGGGYGTGFTAATYVFDIRTGRYTNGPALPYAAATLGLVVLGDWVYCIAGEDQMRHRTNTAFRIRRDMFLPSR